MKKLLLMMLCAVMALSMTACGEKKDNSETTESLLSYYNNDDIYYSHTTDHYSFRLPKFWHGKSNIDVFKGREDFYEITSYDTDGTGLLFSVIEYEDESYKDELAGRDYTYLGYSDLYSLHYVLLMPEEEKFAEEAKEQYNELKDGIKVAKATFTIY